MAFRLSIREEDSAVRQQFTAMAEKARTSHARHDALLSFKALVYQGYANYRWPLELSYAAQACPLLRPTADQSLPGDRYRRNQELGKALGKFGSLPLDDSGKRLLSGADQHERVTSCLEYYIKSADEEIASDNMDVYKESMDGANVVELCIGNGKKAAKIYRKAIARGAKPKHFYVNDIVKDSERKAIDEIGAIFTSSKKITPISGDIFANNYWDQEIWDKLKNDDAPTVVMIHGATFNNFNTEEMRELLERFREKFKEGTQYFVSIDSTNHVPTLKAAYDYFQVAQWLITGFVFGHWILGHLIDPHALGFRLSIARRKEYVAIRPHITNSKDQRFKLSRVHGAAQQFVLRKGSFPTDEVRKLRTRFIRALLMDAKMEIISRLPFKGRGPWRHVRHNIWHFQNGKRIVVGGSKRRSPAC